MQKESVLTDAALDLSSVPDGLNVPGEQGLPAWYYEMEMAYEKGLMASLPPWQPSPEPADGGPVVMDGYFDQRYCERYAYYRKAMEVYLLQTLRLDVYDRQVEDSGLSFILMPENEKGSHQRLSALGLKHLYVQNSPHIERLCIEDVALLNRFYNENGRSGAITQEALDLVARTYQELIREYNPTTKAPYDSELITHLDGGAIWDPDSLVVVFVAPYHYDESGNSIPEDIPLMYQREDWLVAELPKMRQQMMERVDVPVTLVISNLSDSWTITVDDEIRRGLSPYKPSPNRPAY